MIYHFLIRVIIIFRSIYKNFEKNYRLKLRIDLTKEAKLIIVYGLDVNF